MRISSPPITHSDYYGIDTPSKTALLAANYDLEGMRAFMGANSLAFLSVDGIYRAVGYDGRDDVAPQFTDHCFTGEYPTELTDQNGQAGTLVAWVKARNVAGPAAIFGRCDKRYDDVTLYITGGKLLVGVDYDSQGGASNAKFTATSKANISPDKWVMAAVTWDGRNYTLYINGEKDSVVASTLVPPKRATTVVVGENPPGNPEALSGHIGGLMMFDRNLSDGEIKGLYGLSGIPAR